MTADPFAVNAWRPRSRLSPESVRRIEFSRAPLGRRGYLESDVERFRSRMAEEISRHDAEMAELREEIDRLRNYFRDININPVRPARDNGHLEGVVLRGGHTGHTGEFGPSVQSVNMMSAAQQAADRHIAQAQDYARQLIGHARGQCEHILREAHRQAEEAAEQAARSQHRVAEGHAVATEHAELEAKITYLRTFAEVSRVQMRSILEELGSQLDRLTDLGVPAPGGPVSLDGEPHRVAVTAARRP